MQIPKTPLLGRLIKTTVIFFFSAVILKTPALLELYCPSLINFVEAKWLLNNGVFNLFPVNRGK